VDSLDDLPLLYFRPVVTKFGAHFKAAFCLKKDEVRFIGPHIFASLEN
jgi:hypothetical protein